MRRTLLSVGVSAGASLRERKSLGDFPNPPVSLPKSGGKPEKRLALRQVFFLVCPPGLEPGPGASEGVKSYALCIFLRFFFDFLHISMLFLA